MAAGMADARLRKPTQIHIAPEESRDQGEDFGGIRPGTQQFFAVSFRKAFGDNLLKERIGQVWIVA